VHGGQSSNRTTFGPSGAYLDSIRIANDALIEAYFHGASQDFRDLIFFSKSQHNQVEASATKKKKALTNISFLPSAKIQV
jgi:hypothetical protein